MSAEDPGARAHRDRVRRDAALLTPIAGLILISPPVITLFATDARIFGAPTIVLYIFAVWLLLILIARRLAARLDEG